MSSRSTIIAVTSSEPPYLYDLPHILSLPNGFEGRFRYFVDWVAPDVAKQADRGVSFAGRELILVFHSLETGRLLPVRKAEVIELQRRGPMYHLRFVVHEFPACGRDLIIGPDRSAARERDSDWLTQVGAELVGVEGRDLTSRLPKSAFLRETPRGWQSIRPPAGVATDDELDRRWAAMAALVMEEPHLRDVPLFFLQGVVDRRGKEQKPKEMDNDFAEGGKSGCGFKLTSRKRYHMQLLQWRGEEKKGEEPPTYRVVCSTDPSTVALEGQSDLVLGKYDVLEYAIQAQSPGYSEVSLKVEASDAGGASPEGSRWPELYAMRVPVQVKRDKWRMAGLFVAGLVGLLLYVIPLTPIAPDWVTDRITVLAQLLGLALLFGAYGEVLSGYARFASQAGRLTPGPGSGGG